MSICVCGRIKRKCIDEDLLERLLSDYYSSGSDIVRKKDGNCVTYEIVNSEDDVIISFVNERKAPYNVYDSTITGDEFEYVQLILFDINKEKATIDQYKKIIRFLIYIKQKINSDILITSDVHNDICLLKNQEIIWSRELQARELM
ncbi:MAG: hypothetical protein NC092_05700 [Butyrivibrio sp.]|nr:hypothetical protein [Muribaculum sp.]MCM1552170.1 hypothetical protein [Butyrivibrio sp.]